MYNNPYKRRNSFGGNEWNKRDDFKLQQDIDRQNNYKETFNEYKNIADNLTKNKNMAYRSAKPTTYGVMGTSVPNYNADTWTGGINNKSFDKEFGSVYGHNGNYGNNDVYGKWSNYGSVGSSGNVFGDDYKLSDYTSPNVKSEYEQTKANWQNELDLYKQAYENYKGTLSSASEQRQKAYIRKQYDIKNAMEQSTALGRGGLGTTESGYNRINNNYLNTYNGINDQANETLDDVLNDYKNAYNNIQNQNRLLEQLAKDKQTDYWTQYFINHLDGLDDKVGAIDAAKNTEPLAYGDNKKVKSYIDRDSENELLEYIKAYKNAENRSYFLDGKDFEDTANNYIDAIKGLGSENEAYNDYLNFIEQQKAAEETKKPENYQQRGAVANVGHVSGNVADHSFGKNRITFNGKNYFPMNDVNFRLANDLSKFYPNATIGDVYDHKEKLYVFTEKGWRTFRIG